MGEPLTPELEAEIRKLAEEADEWAGPPVVSLNARRLGTLLAEIDRLRRGDFTPEEFQTLCHNLEEKQPGCSLLEFARGCHQYQMELFGKAATGAVIPGLVAEENQRLRELLWKCERLLGELIALTEGTGHKNVEERAIKVQDELRKEMRSRTV